MTTHTQDREETIAVLSLNGIPLPAIRAILRNAQTVQRVAVAACNRELTKAEERADVRATDRLQALAKAHGFKVKCSGDPRGYCVKVILPQGQYNTWGGKESGWGIPAKG